MSLLPHKFYHSVEMEEHIFWARGLYIPLDRKVECRIGGQLHYHSSLSEADECKKRHDASRDRYLNMPKEMMEQYRETRKQTGNHKETMAALEFAYSNPMALVTSINGNNNSALEYLKK